jgi:hypothetical protein
MNKEELVRDMYSRLNLIVNELNSIGLTKLEDADTVRRIILVLPQDKYASIVTILHNMEDLRTMTPMLVIGRLVGHLRCHRRWVKKKTLHQAKL